MCACLAELCRVGYSCVQVGQVLCRESHRSLIFTVPSPTQGHLKMYGTFQILLCQFQTGHQITSKRLVFSAG